MKSQSPLYPLLNEINTAAEKGLPFLAVTMTVALPDICVSLSSADGRTNGKLYRKWCDDNLPREKFSFVTSEDLYSMRCGVVHNGRFGDLSHNVEPVFRYTDTKAVNRRIVAVCKRAEIEKRTTHSAGRHSFGTNAMAVPDADIKAAMDAGGWKSAKLFLETYVHSHDAGKSLAEKFDKQTGLVGTDLAQANSRKGYRFGKKR